MPKELRKCACGAKIGTPMHAIEKCPLFDNERRKTKIRLRELGLLDENIWNLIVKAGGAMKPWPEPVEKKRAVLFEVNAFIARIMDRIRKRLVRTMDAPNSTSARSPKGKKDVNS